MNKKRFIALAFLCSAVFMASGCQGKVSSTPSQVDISGSAATESPAASVPIEESAAAPAVSEQAASSTSEVLLMSYQEAVELVQGEYPDALPLMCSLDYERGSLIWEVEVLAQDGIVYDAVVDMQNKTILNTQRDDDWPEVQRDAVQVSYVQAVDAAMAANPGSTFESFDLERGTGGQIAYDIELRDAANREINVAVSAQTGEIIPHGGTAPSAVSAAHHAAHGYDHDNHDDYDDYDDLYDFHD